MKGEEHLYKGDAHCGVAGAQAWICAWVSPWFRVSKHEQGEERVYTGEKLSGMLEHEWSRKAAGGRVQGIRTSHVKRNSAQGCQPGVGLNPSKSQGELPNREQPGGG